MSENRLVWDENKKCFSLWRRGRCNENDFV